MTQTLIFILWCILFLYAPNKSGISWQWWTIVISNSCNKRIKCPQLWGVIVNMCYMCPPRKLKLATRGLSKGHRETFPGTPLFIINIFIVCLLLLIGHNSSTYQNKSIIISVKAFYITRVPFPPCKWSLIN